VSAERQPFIELAMMNQQNLFVVNDKNGDGEINFFVEVGHGCGGEKKRKSNSYCYRPFAGQHPINHQIFKPIIKPLAIAEGAFVLEAQMFRNCPAAGVSYSAPNFHPIQLKLVEGEVDQSPATLRHETATLKIFGQPVTHRRGAIQPVKIVKADYSGNFAMVMHANDKSRPLLQLFLGFFDEFGRIFDRLGRVQPRKPMSQVNPVCIGQGEKLPGIAAFDRFQQNIPVNNLIKHGMNQ
jgi:hypothetical protein